MGERVWFATSHWDQRPVGMSDSHYADWLRDRNSGFSGFPFPVLSGELWDGVTYRKSDGTIITFEDWLAEDAGGGGYGPGGGPDSGVLSRFTNSTHPASAVDPRTLAVGPGTDYWLKFNTLEEAVFHYWRPARLNMSESTYQHSFETKERGFSDNIESTLKTKVTSLSYPLSSNPVFIDRAPIFPGVNRLYKDSYYFLWDYYSGNPEVDSGSNELPSATQLALVRSGIYLGVGYDEAETSVIFNANLEGLENQVKIERTDSGESIWWSVHQVATDFFVDDYTWRLTGIAKVGEFYYGRTTFSTPWGDYWYWYNSPLRSGLYLEGYEYPSSVHGILMPRGIPSYTYEAEYGLIYNMQAYPVPVSVKGAQGQEIASGEVYMNVHNRKGDYNISQSISVSGGITIRPDIYIPYANSKGQAVWDVTSGAQLQNPVS